jgi:hypothetical protein
MKDTPSHRRELLGITKNSNPTFNFHFGEVRAMRKGVPRQTKSLRTTVTHMLLRSDSG